MDQIPKVKRSIVNGTSGEVDQREKERVAEMQQFYPGIGFTTYPSNPLTRVERLRSKPWGDLPLAKFNPTVDPSSEHLENVIKAYKKWKDSFSGYVTFNDLKFESGLSFQQVFSAIQELRKTNPHFVRFTVNRMGDNVYVKIMAHCAYNGPVGSVVEKEFSAAAVPPGQTKKKEQDPKDPKKKRPVQRLFMTDDKQKKEASMKNHLLAVRLIEGVDLVEAFVSTILSQLASAPNAPTDRHDKVKIGAPILVTGPDDLEQIIQGRLVRDNISSPLSYDTKFYFSDDKSNFLKFNDKYEVGSDERISSWGDKRKLSDPSLYLKFMNFDRNSPRSEAKITFDPAQNAFVRVGTTDHISIYVVPASSKSVNTSILFDLLQKKMPVRWSEIKDTDIETYKGDALQGLKKKTAYGNKLIFWTSSKPLEIPDKHGYKSSYKAGTLMAVFIDGKWATIRDGSTRYSPDYIGLIGTSFDSWKGLLTYSDTAYVIDLDLLKSRYSARSTQSSRSAARKGATALMDPGEFSKSNNSRYHTIIANRYSPPGVNQLLKDIVDLANKEYAIDLETAASTGSMRSYERGWGGSKARELAGNVEKAFGLYRDYLKRLAEEETYKKEHPDRESDYLPEYGSLSFVKQLRSLYNEMVKFTSK